MPGIQSQSKNSVEKRVVILGAGPAGLYAAWQLVQLGHRVSLVERSEVAGGLCASLERGANVYSHGTHSFHDADQAFIEKFQELMGGRLIERRREILIKLQGRFYNYPLKAPDLLKSMKYSQAAVCLLGLLLAILTGPFQKTVPQNAEEAIIRLYGKGFYKKTFYDYTQRFWGMSPRYISAIFVNKRLPRVDAVENIKRLLLKIGLRDKGVAGRLTEVGHPKMYSSMKGMGEIFQKLSEDIIHKGGQLYLNSEAVQIQHAGGQIHSVLCRSRSEEYILPCDFLISTIPIKDLILRLQPKPKQEIIQAAEALGFRALITIGYLVQKQSALKSMFAYFQDRIFHRLTEPKNSGISVWPQNQTTLLAETTCDVNDDIWENPLSLAEKVKDDLVAEDIIPHRGSIRETHVFKAAEAYPKYTVGFETYLTTLRSFLESLTNVVSTGRQGRFEFLNAATSMKTAWLDVLAKWRDK